MNCATSTPTIAAIRIFPVKSCASLSLDAARVEPRGLAGDRRWMVTDTSGRFLTARKHPMMVLIRATPTATGLRLGAPSMPDIDVAVPHGGDTTVVRVWHSDVVARIADAEANDWISTCLGLPAQLVHMPDSSLRAVDPAYGRAGDIVGFADGFPLLLIAQASLDALNARLAEPVPMLRFRPNLVVAGVSAHAEDRWRTLLIGGAAFDVVKPCTRCVLTTVDVERGDFDPRGEPLRTLSGYRRTALGVEFGQNLIPRSAGVVRCGDDVTIVA